MKRSVLLAGLMVAGMTLGASAEKQHQPKAKPTYSDEKSKSRPVKAPTATRSYSAQELRKIEQSGARVSAPRRSEEGRSRRTAGAKPLKQEANPPIRFASSGNSGGGKGKNSQAANAYKGRLRHKGSHR